MNNMNQMEHNKDILWNASSDAILDVDSEGKLSVISKWNIFGRLWKWIRDLKGTVSGRIHFVVSQTLIAIQDSNARGRLVYLKKQIKTSCFSLRCSSEDELSYPADYLAKKLKESSQFASVTSIQEIASSMMSNSQKNLYPQSRQSILDIELPSSLSDDQRDRRVLPSADIDLQPLPEEL